MSLIEDTSHASANELMTADGLVDLLTVSYTHLDVYKRQPTFWLTKVASAMAKQVTGRKAKPSTLL